jgi:hypothetical protein
MDPVSLSHPPSPPLSSRKSVSPGSTSSKRDSLELKDGKIDYRSCPKYMECVETKESDHPVCDLAERGESCDKKYGSVQKSFGDLLIVNRNEITWSWLPRRASG